MSGGHWNYQSYKLQEQGEYVKAVFDLLAEIEHELDWGMCGDTCHDCAKKRVPEALEAFFDGNLSAALALLRDDEQHQCDSCVKEM